MRCYYHRDREAVGSCKSCGKGLCPECAVDLTKGLACRGRCEAAVEAVINLVERNIRVSPTTTRLVQASGSARLAGSLFIVVCGVVFLAFGLLSERRLNFVAILGACFLGYGLFLYFWSRRIGTQARPDDSRERPPFPPETSR
jgi:hypothetical protein